MLKRCDGNGQELIDREVTLVHRLLMFSYEHCIRSENKSSAITDEMLGMFTELNIRGGLLSTEDILPSCCIWVV